MPDQAGSTQNCDVINDSMPFDALDDIHRQLRHAVEDRNYLRVQELIAQQRAVFDLAGHQHPEAQPHAVAGRDLAAWALTMVRLQRAHDQRALAETGAFKKAAESYGPEPVYAVDCLAEG
jgi:hypothetical protein